MAAPDINALELANEVIDVGDESRAEDFYRLTLPDDGEHLATLSLGQDGVSTRRQKDKSTGSRTGAAFVMAHIAAKIDSANGHPGMTAFDRPTSIVFESKGTSALQAMMTQIDAPIPRGIAAPQVEDHIKVTMAQAPRVKVTTRWVAQYEDTSKPEGSKDRYVEVRKGQANFPPILDDQGQPTGRYETEFVDPKSGKECTTQARIVKYAHI